ncbi:protein fem-1 homolog CG6966 [Thrips palmi]|uniref:Protein fem-1 homolog CG6966 n=1 Tax=Thrips palmi TaxID=161013 RepID=A0A6P8Y243_THRPL|nr:protein fem-1 homolog CG6966 [Thrips palmi]
MDNLDLEDPSDLNVVFNSARDGNLRRLKGYIGDCEQDEIPMLVSARNNGATPLLMACRNGHFDVAEYLIEHCHADIEQRGSVVFDGETIEGAPPLWCAAAAGHFRLVMLLLNHGARVNSTTRSNSTPLRAACYDGHYSIVHTLIEHGADFEIANRHGHTCLMIACYKGHKAIANFLVSLGADVNRRSVKGNTALHDCAESGSLDILILLLSHNAKMDVDSYGMTPLLTASVTGHAHVVQYLIEQENLVSQKEKVDALELLGATYVDKKRDMVGALNYWKSAMNERYNGRNELPKPFQKSTVEAYDHVKEIREPHQLDDLLSDPDEMRMQALVIRERILGPAHPDTSYYVRFRGAFYADTGQFGRCVSLWGYALDMQQRMLEPLNPMTQSSFFSFTELFSYMMGEEGRIPARGRRVPPVSFNDLITVFDKAVKEVEMGNALVEKLPAAERDLTYLHRVIVICLHLACLLTRLLPTLSEAESFHLHKSTYRLVHLGVRGRRGRSVLHLVCSRDSALVGRYPACQFPSPALADLLLTVGADVNAKDEDGNTPLHASGSFHDFSQHLPRILLAHGAHLDYVNNYGNTLEDLLAKRGQPLNRIVNPMQYTRLTCLAARVIQKHKLQYVGIVPKSLESFVQNH